MSVWAYCAQDWFEATAHAAGIIPFVSPSHDNQSIGRYLDRAAAADIVYLNLRGRPGDEALYGQFRGELGPKALTADQVRQHDWSRCLVFAEAPYSARGGGGPIARAFLENGALGFIGPQDGAEGVARPALIDDEAERLFWLFCKFYPHAEPSPEAALDHAKRLLALTAFPLESEELATIEGFVYLSPS